MVFRASALFSRPAPLFCILFSGKTEKSMPAERQLRSRNDNGTVVNTKGSSAPLARVGGQHPQGVCRIRSAPLSLTAARGRPPLHGAFVPSVPEKASRILRMRSLRACGAALRPSGANRALPLRGDRKYCPCGRLTFFAKTAILIASAVMEVIVC